MKQGAGYRLIARRLHRVQKYIVARAVGPHAPRIGSPLFDKYGKKKGITVDVFGPVSRPYILIKGEDVPEYFARARDIIGGV